MTTKNDKERCVFLEEGEPEKLNLIENRITTNHHEGVTARVCSVEVQAKKALDLDKKDDIIN